jgi:hypothetical protein
MSLHDRNGHRKYLTSAERETFLKTADDAEREVRTFWPRSLTPAAGYPRRLR